jgi:hypothetical protein
MPGDQIVDCRRAAAERDVQHANTGLGGKQLAGQVAGAADPTEAYEILPGCCRARATRSSTVRTGRRALAESAMGALPTKPIGAKSLRLS